MTIVAVLQNHEGVRFKTVAIPHFMEEIRMAAMHRLSIKPMEDFACPVFHRRFKFWDREGRAYIYKEVW